MRLRWGRRLRLDRKAGTPSLRNTSGLLSTVAAVPYPGTEKRRGGGRRGGRGSKLMKHRTQEFMRTCTHHVCDPCMQDCAHPYTHTDTSAHTNAQAHTHARTHTHTHTYTVYIQWIHVYEWMQRHVTEGRGPHLLMTWHARSSHGMRPESA